MFPELYVGYTGYQRGSKGGDNGQTLRRDELPRQVSMRELKKE